MKKGFLSTIVAVLLLGAATSSARAVVLDWDSATWTSGSLVQSYDIDPSFAGNDIRITITGATGRFISGTPTINNDITGGLTPVQNALRLQLDLNTKAEFVTVTIDFLNPSGVLLPSFSIFDIDTGSGTSPSLTYQDQIRNIQATFGATSYTPTVTGGSAVTIAGNSATGISNVDNNVSTANAAISVSGGPVTQIRFDYGSGAGAQANPANQGVAIGDISFNSIAAVPEVTTVWISVMALLIAGFYHAYRQRRSDSSLT